MKREKRAANPGLGILTAAVAIAVLVSIPIYQAAYKSARDLTPIEELGGAFEAKNQRGETVSDKTFLGKPTLYFFGFTHCPDVCPATLFELSQHLKDLGKDAKKLNVVFVTVDPARDTVPALRDYLTAFDPRITGLTGTPEQIDKIVKAFRVHAQKAAFEGGYNVDHTASIFAADAQGRVVMIIGYGEDPVMVRAKLKKLLDKA